MSTPAYATGECVRVRGKAGMIVDVLQKGVGWMYAFRSEDGEFAELVAAEDVQGEAVSEPE